MEANSWRLCRSRSIWEEGSGPNGQRRAILSGNIRRGRYSCSVDRTGKDSNHGGRTAGRQAMLALRGLNGMPSGRGVCPWRGCGSPCTRMGQAVKGAGREDSFWGFPEDRGAPRVLRREGIMARHRGPSPPQVRTQRKGDPSPLRTALPIFTCWL